MRSEDVQKIIEREIKFHKQQLESHRTHLLRLQAHNAALKFDPVDEPTCESVMPVFKRDKTEETST